MYCKNEASFLDNINALLFCAFLYMCGETMCVCVSVCLKLCVTETMCHCVCVYLKLCVTVCVCLKLCVCVCLCACVFQCSACLCSGHVLDANSSFSDCIKQVVPLAVNWIQCRVTPQMRLARCAHGDPDKTRQVTSISIQ